jgi:serine O-acetyltransferase
MFEHIRADTVRSDTISGGRGLRAIDVLHILWKNYGLQALVIYRFGRWLGDLRQQPVGWAIALPLCPLYWLLSACIRKAYGIDLKQSADIAPGLYISHFGGIDVRNCRIGPHCAIYQQVKLGSAIPGERKLVIGADVFIGPHAQICADVQVGDGATIGVGTVVTEDIPHRCLVLGNPGRIAQQDYDNSGVL